MQNLKKRPTKQLEKFSTIFTQLGLVLVLFIVYLAIEYETEQIELSIVDYDTPRKAFVNPDQDIVFVKEKLPKPKPIKPSTLFLTDEPIKKGDDKIIESVIIDETPPETKVAFNPDDIIEIVETPKIIEDVPYDFVEQKPIFKGCEGLPKDENKQCFDKKMKKFIQRNFDTELAGELGLRSGIHKIRTQFIIDEKGEVIDIQIRAPHPKLKIETLQTIQKLPKFIPGKQNRNFVKVKYTLPIIFRVD